jgi:hypothetical protein
MPYPYPYDEDVYDTTSDVKELQQKIENNFDALVHNFIGPGPPLGIGVPATGMFWAEHGNGPSFLRVLHPAGVDWITFLDFDTGEVIIAEQQITSNNISNLARKGSIVEGEAIAPVSCSIKAHPVIVSMPTESEQGAEHSFQASGEGGYETLLNYKVYIPQGISTLFMRVRVKDDSGGATVLAKFSVNGNDSSTTNAITTSNYQWTDANQSFADVTSEAGWVDLAIKATSGAPIYTGLMQGLAFRSDDVV